MFYQLALLAVLTLALPVALAATLLASVQPAASVTVATLLVVIGLATGMLLFGLRCLLAPIDDIRRMLHHYRSAGTPRPLGFFLFDEVGALAAEALQTLRENRARLQQTAERDAVTDTLNPHGLERELDWLLARRNGAGDVAVVVFRLHDFRQWQLGLGVDALHAVERGLVDRLRKSCRWDDALAVLGQGRFAVALAARPEDELRSLIERLRKTMSQPLDSEGHRLRTGHDVAMVRAGTAETARTVLEAVESTLEEAHDNGKGEAVSVAANGAGTRQRRRQLAMDLDRALDHGELFAEFQPLVDLGTGNSVGAEALVRWQHPELGVLAPGEFIPLAERHGRIARLGETMLDTAVAAARAWQDGGLHLRVSVNIAAEHLERRSLPGDVAAVLQRHRLVADQLELELTESSLLMDLEGAIEQLAECREMGVHIALDDFGSGYSSLAYLSRLPITRLKIDRSFVQELHQERGRAIVEAIIKLAHGFGLATTAEGIETRKQAMKLAALGCGEGQGFLFARPMRAEDLLAFASQPAPMRNGTST